ncbi:TnsA endonuclease N-terminal domain-containing protein [Pseudomonas sp. W03]|uniref:TnsA endonuclease N-terminal domain-containing protein n=1 Tax=Pseudomonas sp. W03 TaxID=3090666 RepID=UPI003A4D9B95
MTIAAARNVARYHYGKNVVLFPSRKNNCQVICESMLEADYCILLEYDTQVLKYQSQPETLTLIDFGEKLIYTPDFSVEANEELFYVEVKPDRYGLPPKYHRKLRAAEQLLRDRGSTLRLLDSSDIRTHNKLCNLRILYSRSFNTSPEEYTYLVSRTQFLQKHLTLAALLQQLPAVSCSAKYLAIFNGIFGADLNRPLTQDTVLEVLS